jgi:hypothetical protein
LIPFRLQHEPQDRAHIRKSGSMKWPFWKPSENQISWLLLLLSLLKCIHWPECQNKLKPANHIWQRAWNRENCLI